MDEAQIFFAWLLSITLFVASIMLGRLIGEQSTRIRTLEAKCERLTRENARMATMLDYESIADLSLEE